jgi:hypothetical protein
MRKVAHRLRGLVLAILSVMLLAGCGSNVATITTTPRATPTPNPPMPTSLRIIRLAPRQVNVAPFEAQTDQADKVQQLFATLRALPPFVPRSSCPNDSGGLYLLTFWDHNSVVAEVSISAGGCPSVNISKPYGCHDLAETTMSQIADTLGVAPAQVGRMGQFYNTATPGGPLAPDELPASIPLLPFAYCYGS